MPEQRLALPSEANRALLDVVKRLPRLEAAVFLAAEQKMSLDIGVDAAGANVDGEDAVNKLADVLLLDVRVQLVDDQA